MTANKEKARLRPYEGGRLQGRYFMVPRYALTWGLSPLAALAYGLLLDRAVLSARNGWRDRDGRLFVQYSVAALSRDLDVSTTTGKRALAELEGQGLLRRSFIRGKPSRLYLMALTDDAPAEADRTEPPEIDTSDIDRLYEELRRTHPEGGGPAA